MSRIIDELPEMYAAECPIEWAYENLREIGCGHHARIYEHPVDKGLVVRVTDGPDGWFGHATLALEMPPRIRVHAPVVTEIVSREDGYFMAFAERLEPFPDTPDGEETLACAIAIASGCGLGELPRAAVPRFLQGQPNFVKFLEALARKPTDLRGDNWLLRGGTVVLNDPWQWMTPEMETAVAERWPSGKDATPAMA